VNVQGAFQHEFYRVDRPLRRRMKR
jgi:hypothetical protein